MLWRKTKQNREGSAGLGFAIFSGGVSGGLTEKETFEQIPGKGERRRKMGTWGAVFQGRRTYAICTGQQEAVHLACLSSSRRPVCPAWRGEGRGHALPGCVSGLGLSQRRPWACGFRSLQGHRYSQASSCLPGSLGKHSPKGSTASSCLGWEEENVSATWRERGQ